MAKKLKVILSIAGSDPMGGAGIQADIRTGVSLGIHVLTAITAVTAQNSKGIKELGILSPEILKAQIDSATEDCMPDAIKIGMIGSLNNLLIISNFLKSLKQNIPVVLDPVLESSANRSKMSDINDNKRLAELFSEFLFPYITVITPNLEEYKILEKQPFILEKKLPVILKGGHSESKICHDRLIMTNEELSSCHTKKLCHNLHGSGCVYSTLLASYLALGNSLKKAFYLSSNKMYEIILNSCDYSLGNSHYGPLNINHYQYDNNNK